MEDVGILNGHLVYFIAIWHILRLLVYFKAIWCILPVLVSCSKKNLATLRPVQCTADPNFYFFPRRGQTLLLLLLNSKRN
jgi:hypothetical protein